MATNGIVCEQLNDCGPSCKNKVSMWRVPEVLNSHTSQIKYAILILNRPLTQNQMFIKRLWNNATIRMTVDGGTRQWDNFLSTLSEKMTKNIKNPDLVTGDFDSITKEVLEKYKQKGCKTIHTPDQNDTDFTKALIELNIHCNQLEIEISQVLAFAQTSGRIDQILGNIQTLFLAKEKPLLRPHTSVYIISDDAISWLLYPGQHIIEIPEATRKHKRAWCSLIPVGKTCNFATTTGLKWNLDNQPLRFGQLVSTSNTFDGSERVTISCSDTIFWSMKIPCVMEGSC